MYDPVIIKPREMEKWIARQRRVGIPDMPARLPNIKAHENVHLRRTNHEYARHYVDIRIKDLEHLKQLVGVPDHLLENNGKSRHVPYPMKVCDVPSERIAEFADFSVVEQRAVVRAAKNMLYGHSRALGLTDAQYELVSKWIGRNAGSIPWFLAPGLEVMDGQVCKLDDAAGYTFNWIVVHGSGSIQLAGAAKVSTCKMVTEP